MLVVRAIICLLFLNSGGSLDAILQKRLPIRLWILALCISLAYFCRRKYAFYMVAFSECRRKYKCNVAKCSQDSFEFRFFALVFGTWCNCIDTDEGRSFGRRPTAGYAVDLLGIWTQGLDSGVKMLISISYNGSFVGQRHPYIVDYIQQGPLGTKAVWPNNKNCTHIFCSPTPCQLDEHSPLVLIISCFLLFNLFYLIENCTYIVILHVTFLLLVQFLCKKTEMACSTNNGKSYSRVMQPTFYSDHRLHSLILHQQS